LLCSIFSNAQSVQERHWTLGECVDYAIEHNISIKQKDIDIERSRNTLKGAYMNLIPKVSGSLGHTMNWGKSVNVQELQISTKLTQSTSASVDARIALFEGLAKLNTIKSDKLALKIEEHNSQALKNSVSIQVAQAYLQVLLQYEISELSKKTCEASSQQVANTRILVDEGSKPYSTLLEMEAKASQDTLTMVNAANELTNAYLSLTQLLNLPLEQQLAFDVEIPQQAELLTDPSGLNFSAIYEDALNLPQIRSAELALEKSEYDLKVAKSYYYPTISMNATYGTYYTDTQDAAFFTQFNDNRNPYLGFTLSVPIFSGLNAKLATKNAGLNLQNSRLTLDLNKQELYKLVQSVYIDVLNAYKKYQAAMSSSLSSKESWNVINFKAQEGAATTTEVIVAMNNWYSSESECLQAKYQYLFNLKILDFYRGIPIR